MGEYSKRVGDVGEDIVSEFLNLIGWQSVVNNIDIPSVDKEHRSKSNGLDGYFYYKDPMVSSNINSVLYSIKYSAKGYPNSTELKTKFKEHFLDLSKAIESFQKSTLKQDIMQANDDIQTFTDCGLLFWLNNFKEGDNDLISKLENTELPDIDFDSIIYLVDNKRIEFVYNFIKYVNHNYRDYDIDFPYFPNGLNGENNNLRNGKIMPIQYINSSIIPIRAFKNNESVFILATIDKFSKDDLIKLIGVVKNISSNFQGKTEICFPDYLETEHRPSVQQIIQNFQDPTFTQYLKVSSYTNSLFK